MTTSGGFSNARLERLRNIMSAHVERGDMPGLVWLVSRRGETHVEAVGRLGFGDSVPMRRDTIFRIASMSKPIAATVAMILVEECKLCLDDPVDEFLPELANRKVLRHLGSALDDTLPANRAVTLRDLLTFRFGIGAIMEPAGTHPIQTAISEAGLAPGPNAPSISPDEWMKRLGSLPLIHQPGEQWLYHTGSDAIGVLVARATGMTFEAFLQERIFSPLGMKDTGFHVSAEKRIRFATSYKRDPRTGKLIVYDDPATGRWSTPPVFQSGGAGLVSTAGDYLAFCRMMLNKGLYDGPEGPVRILSRPTVELMTSDQLTPAQKADAHLFFGTSTSWGFGLAVAIKRENIWETPGRFGWDGGLGTSGYSDPHENMVSVLLTQRMMEDPTPPRAFRDFWTASYQAIDD
jgi:CubicO group peptidase (beta-lactamase class C family)